LCSNQKKRRRRRRRKSFCHCFAPLVRQSTELCSNAPTQRAPLAADQ